MGRNRSEWGDERHASTLQRLIILSWGGQKYDEDTHHGNRLTDALTDKEVAGKMVDWIERTYDSEETKLHMRNAIRTFGKILTTDDPTAKDADPPD